MKVLLGALVVAFGLAGCGASPRLAAPVVGSATIKAKSVSSVLYFDGKNPEVQKAARALGWVAQGTEQVTVNSGSIAYTADNGKTTKTAFLNYNPYHGYRQCFVLNVAPGTAITYAIKAKFSLTDLKNGGTAQRAEQWFNNGGANYQTVTKAD